MGSTFFTARFNHGHRSLRALTRSTDFLLSTQCGMGWYTRRSKGGRTTAGEDDRTMVNHGRGTPAGWPGSPVTLVSRSQTPTSTSESGKFSNTSTLFLRSPARCGEIALVSKVAYYT